MTPEEARAALENDVEIRSSHMFAVSVLEEAAMLAERERCARLADELATHGDWNGHYIAARIRQNK